MKILFCFYNCGSGLSTHGGLALLSALAKKEGHEVQLLHFHEKLVPDDVEVYSPLVKAFDPDLVAFSATDFEYSQVELIARNIKAIKEVPILLGGKSAIEIATKDITNTPFNAFCIGEAELPWLEFLDDYENCRDFFDCEPCMKTLDGMWFIGNDKKLYTNPLGKNVTDLDSLPFPDYSIFNMDEIIKSKGGWLNVQFSRGCVYNCTYCYVTADKYQMFDKTKGEGRYGLDKYLRNNSVDYSIKLLKFLREQYPSITTFNLDDELPVSIEMHLGRGFDWWKQFCTSYRDNVYREYGTPFCCNGRINLMTEEIIELMAVSGCKECRMGFESGSYRIRKDILDKPITDENMRQVYQWCDKHGLKTTSFTMIGNPTETYEDIDATIRMTAELKPWLIRLTFCYPFLNTRLWFYVKKHDLVKEDKLYKQHGYFEESVIKLPIEDQHLMMFRHLFPWFVNMYMLEEEDSKRYLDYINMYSNIDFTDAKSINTIIDIDKELSLLMGDKEHFCYFGGNTSYYNCKNKRYANGQIYT